MKPEILAALARMANREAEAQVATGEPCRCPEHATKCVCGAYVPADTWSSASRQHFIDTGRYLAVGEVA